MFHHLSVLRYPFRMCSCLFIGKRWEEEKSFYVYFFTLSAFRSIISVAENEKFVVFVLFSILSPCIYHISRSTDYELLHKKWLLPEIVYFSKLEALQRNKSTFTYHLSSCYWTKRDTEKILAHRKCTARRTFEVVCIFSLEKMIRTNTVGQLMDVQMQKCDFLTAATHVVYAFFAFWII